MSKYQPLGDYLKALPASQETVTLTFGQVEKIIDSRLPRSAREYRQWWENQKGGSHAPHWRAAGFKTGKVDMERQVVPFHRLSEAELRPGRKPSAAGERALKAAFLNTYERAKQETGYSGRRFKRSLGEHGAWRTAKKLLARSRGGISEGLKNILDAGRPDLCVEHDVLREEFQRYFNGEELATARDRLGLLARPSIADLVAEIEHRAPDHPFGTLQNIRERLKGLDRVSRTIFGAQTIHDTYAFHYGGRTELQFNIGFEEDEGGRQVVRHGLVLSLKRGASINEIGEEMLTRVSRINEFIDAHSNDLTPFHMYSSRYDSNEWSGYHNVRPIPAELVSLDAFFFIGRHQRSDDVSVALILRDFDRLLPLYEFAEGGKDRTFFEQEVEAGVLVPGLRRKPSSTTMSTVARRIDRTQRHNDIQFALGKYLQRRHGKNHVGDEQQAGGGNKIDLVVDSGKKRIYYEIKVASTAKQCIRQGLGQLLEYSYWPGARKAKELVIVGEPERDEEAARYTRELRKRFKLPIYYRKFDMATKELLG